MDSDITHIITKDGSSTLFAPRFNQHYHSLHGAIQESLHVFIRMGLQKRMEAFKAPIKILEMGFGTGLNAFLTALETPETPVQYVSLEAFPLTEDQVGCLNYPQEIQNENHKQIFLQIHQAPWEKDWQVNENFTLHKKQVTLQKFEPNRRFDLVYFDAFAPESQPELWTATIFEKIYEWSEPQAIFVTYSAKGDVRRALQKVGFKVEKLPGPPGKREMLRAVKAC